MAVPLIGALLTSSCGGHDPESPAAKHENSVLEAVFAQHVNVPIHGAEFVESEDVQFICVPLNGKRIWVMLNPKTEPYYKQMPQGNYSLKKEDFELVQQKGIASPTVLSCLKSHIDGQ